MWQEWSPNCWRSILIICPLSLVLAYVSWSLVCLSPRLLRTTCSLNAVTDCMFLSILLCTVGDDDVLQGKMKDNHCNGWLFLSGALCAFCSLFSHQSIVNILDAMSDIIQSTPSNSFSPVTALHHCIFQWCVLMDSRSRACWFEAQQWNA